jgi:hypothetical protein
MTLKFASGIDAEILDRRRNPYTSTFPSEIITCRFRDGRTLRLLCKYSRGCEHNAFGHRGGVGYEASVYRRVLAPLGVSAPRFHGEFTEAGTGQPWLAIEFVANAVLADEAPDVPRALESAAAWVGRFHTLAANVSLDFLNRYDGAYYAQWSSRTRALAAHWHGRLPWLEQVFRIAPDQLRAIAGLPSTVIHGEFTPHNVLVSGDDVFPVDWESAAIGLAEIDLVCLTDKWPSDIAARCERAYANARFPSGPPLDWPVTLDLARLYWDFRWLGDRPDWTGSEKVRPRFEHLRQVAERLGLL